MPRKATVRWAANTRAWRSDVGPYSPKSGRRQPVYFRELPNTPKGRRQAEALLEEYLRDRDRREQLAEAAVGNPATWQVVEAYLQHSERTVEPRTFAGHAERLGVWMRQAPGALADEDGVVLDARPARQLRASDLQRVVRRMSEDGYSAHYVAGMVRSVKACWAWAARPDDDRQPPRLVPEDVFAGVRGPKIPDAPERYLPAPAAEALLGFIEARAAAAAGLTGEFERLTALLFRCLYESGARPHELCRARWTDLHAEGFFVFRKHKTSGKVGRPRIVPLPAALAAAVRAAGERPGRHPEFIFTHRRGRGAAARGAADAAAGEPWQVGPLGQKFRKLREAAARAGLDVRVRDGTGRVPDHDPECTLYDFRRTFSTDSGSAGFSDERTAATMGNSAQMVARVYQTRHAAAAVAVAEAVAERRRGSGGGG